MNTITEERTAAPAAPVVAPTADVDPRARIGGGSRVWHLAQVREDAVVGENCILGPRFVRRARRDRRRQLQAAELRTGLRAGRARDGGVRRPGRGLHQRCLPPCGEPRRNAQVGGRLALRRGDGPYRRVDRRTFRVHRPGDSRPLGARRGRVRGAGRCAGLRARRRGACPPYRLGGRGRLPADTGGGRRVVLPGDGDALSRGRGTTAQSGGRRHEEAVAAATWIIAGLSAAFVIAVGGFVITQLPLPHSGTAADSPQGASATQSASGSGPRGPGRVAVGRPGGGGSSRSGGGPENPPPTAGKRYTTEVIPAAPATPHRRCRRAPLRRGS